MCARRPQQLDEQLVLEAARRDPNVTQPLAADRRLYVAGLSWFFALCRRHAIATRHADRRSLAETLALSDVLRAGGKGLSGASL